MEWTTEDKKKENFDNVAKDILYKMLDNNMFSKIQTCTTAKEIWEKLTQIYDGNQKTKENKLTDSLQKFELIRMKPRETMTDFDERFNSVMIELTILGKEYNNRELALKVMRALPKEWDVKTMAMRETKDLNKLELHDIFANLKAYEFVLETRKKSESSTSQPTQSLVVTVSYQSSQSKSAEELSNDVMALFVEKFGKFMRKHNSKPNAFDCFKKNSTSSDDDKWYNCGRPGHFIVDSRKPKQDAKKQPERSRPDKKFHRKKRSEKSMVAEENKSSWADTDSEKSSSGTSSSSDSENEVRCLMADDTDEVFNFSNTEFTREDLVTALNDMFSMKFRLKRRVMLLKLSL
ncbi:hypothetical protein F511_22909 [Dorcoceras hygrometricum]|uniref:CCHC-type domain-containing protein n=1 Tax=Dorcoceras hygrometricum TaxID=472368 RepID=A0A2Z7C1U2_9LAMI|nr:hypothetical protein F511_22909 [Dorcoceras hygrometricum]